MSLTLPDYRVVQKLGVGANSSLYAIEHLETGEMRTAKYVQLRASEEDDKKFIAQLRAEQATGKAMEHPVLRKVYEIRYIRKMFRLQAAILMMEFVDGTSMSSTSFQPTVPALLRYFRRLAEGLHAMHHAGFVHADLKPGNLLVTPDDEIKLIDFGQSSAILQAKERVQGTPDYMAPEQTTRSVLDQRTDVFGLGATLYRVLTGRAWKTEMNRTAGMNLQGRIGKRLNDMNRPISEDIPTCVMRFIEDCCRPEPVARLVDMRAVVNRIDLTQTILEHQALHDVDQSDDARSA